MIWVFEGIDGSGKDALVQHMVERHKFNRLAFPDRSTITGRAIDRYLRGQSVLDPLLFQCLQVVNRWEKEATLRAYAHHPTQHLAIARYWPSGMVYGYLDGLPQGWSHLVSSGLPYDFMVLLDVDPAEGLRRVASRGATREVYERLDTLSFVREEYLRLWSSNYATPKRSWQVWDANRPLEEVTAKADALQAAFQDARL